MHPDYGKQIGQAFAAVWQLHKDVSRLLTDTLARLRPSRNYNTAVFKDLSYTLHTPDGWMPYAVCVPTTGGDLPPNVIETFLVHFWDEPPKPQEPHLVVARLTYRMSEDGRMEPAFWDAWEACFDWTDTFPVRLVHRDTFDDDRVESVAVTAVPLFDITSVDDVLRLVEEVRAVANAAGTSGTMAAPVRTDP
jgi:hypothetical protein